MCHVNDGKSKKRNNKRNRTTKSGKYQTALREGKLQVLGNIAVNKTFGNNHQLELMLKTSKGQNNNSINNLNTKIKPIIKNQESKIG